VRRRTGDAAKLFHAFPRISKDFQGKSKLFQAFSKEIPNIFLGDFQRNQRLGGDSGHFRFFCRLPVQAVPSEPLSPTTTAAELRFFECITTFAFPEDNVAPLRLARALRNVPDEARLANEPGRDLRIAALGARRWKRRLDAKTERSQRVVKIRPTAAVVGDAPIPAISTTASGPPRSTPNCPS
jgi:hypothetical protein